MIVFLLRAAVAVDVPAGVPAAARHLAPEGRRAARRLGDRLRWYDVTPSAIWTSPEPSAIQTAELWVAGLGWDGPVEVVAGLANDASSVAEVVRAGQAPDAQIVVVGNAPTIGRLGAILTGQARLASLGPGQIVRLDDVAAQRRERRAPLVPRWSFGPGDDVPRALAGDGASIPSR
jgi:phosphohistidine phosphatase SixA